MLFLHDNECMYVYNYMYIYIYMYGEREREREREMYVYIAARAWRGGDTGKQASVQRLVTRTNSSNHNTAYEQEHDVKWQAIIEQKHNNKDNTVERVGSATHARGETLRTRSSGKIRGFQEL